MPSYFYRASIAEVIFFQRGSEPDPSLYRCSSPIRGAIAADWLRAETPEEPGGVLSAPKDEDPQFAMGNSIEFPGWKVKPDCQLQTVNRDT